MNSNEKVVVITGAAGGIGRAVAAKYAKEGAKLVLIDMSQDSLLEIARELNLNNDNSLLMTLDVSKEEQVKFYVDKTIIKFGRIDVFVNNAGIEGQIQNIIDTTEENLDRVLGVNVKGVMFGLKYVLPHMIAAKQGSVINTASVAGFIGSQGLASYVASKHAVIGITKTAALEVGEHNVRVNAVCPGPVNNRMMRSIEEGIMPGSGEEVKKGFEANIPLGRYAENEEVASIIYYLGSDEAKYITGTTIRIDGGMGAK